MKRLIAPLAFVLTAATTSFPAWAVEPPDLVPADPHMTTDRHLMGPAQRVSGTITEIDANKGSVSLAAAGGTFELHFPPLAIHDLKKGDRMTAEFALAKADTPPGTTRAFDAPRARGEHRMSGTIGSVDHTGGWIEVKTAETTLKLRFPPQRLADLKPGDRVSIDLAFTRES